jgi:broad specificity phosphatase PhoE
VTVSHLVYVSHPNVQIDPAVPVPDWGLSAEGRRRTQLMLGQVWISSIGRVVSSPERKARETADLIADHLGLEVEVRAATGEIDRSSTGFVSHERHEALADRLFGEPDLSADGWETARDAQSRIVTALDDLLVDDGGSDVVVGHGGVGTLLFCHLARLDIARQHDQPGQGHHWAFDRSSGAVVHRWRPVDQLD